MKYVSAEMQAKYENWKKINTDPYGSAAVRYADRWVAMMEKEMTAKKIDDTDAAAVAAYITKRADKTSTSADTEGITGFMHGAAIGALAACWLHGAALRDWHNEKFGVAAGAAGTVNPAVVTVTT